MELNKIAFGGGCHWCTEAVFHSLIGVEKVAQGWVASINNNSSFSEAVIVHYKEDQIDLKTLIYIHLLTLQSTSNHSMRTKYRSAIYYYSLDQQEKSNLILKCLQNKFTTKIITQTLPFYQFKPSAEEFKNYYISNPTKPFCKKYINPKLQLLLTKFKKQLKTQYLLN